MSAYAEVERAGFATWRVCVRHQFGTTWFITFTRRGAERRARRHVRKWQRREASHRRVQL